MKIFIDNQKERGIMRAKIKAKIKEIINKILNSRVFVLFVGIMLFVKTI